MHSVFLLLGSNQGDREVLLKEAVNNIVNRVGKVGNISSIYESEPWGFDAEVAFLNQIIEVQTTLCATKVLSEVLMIESDMGRIRKSKNYESRVIDIDILFFDTDVINTADLIVPHPRLHERMFTLMPLLEMDSLMPHPVLNKTIQELVDVCTDKLKVEKYS